MTEVPEVADESRDKPSLKESPLLFGPILAGDIHPSPEPPLF